jgi:hypothetical protein
MKKWFCCTTQHAQKNTIFLYCREQENELLVYLIHESDGNTRYLIRDSLKANIKELVLNQYSDSIQWVEAEKDFTGAQWEFDMLQARKRNGSSDTIDYLRYHLANAINDTQNNRGFSRYAKKKIVGEWSNPDLTISFYGDGKYSWQNLNQKKSTVFSCPSNGIWDISSNMRSIVLHY